MRIVIEAPRDSRKYPKMFSGKFLSAGLLLDDIFIGEEHKNFTLDWNDIYGFYDLILTPHYGNGKNAQKTHWKELEEWLKKNGYKYEVNYTYWKDKCRFWIYPKKEEK